VIIEGEVTDGVVSAPVTSTWRYNPDDPWVVNVDFHEDEVTWGLSLELLREVLSSPPGGLQGSGDLLIELSDGYAILHLSNGGAAATVKIPADKMQEFLGQVDDRDSDELVARELDKFLDSLEVE
jgi:hypothetical protein